ncbi:MAG: GNAT family N-acetyltransferase [Marinicaulis sp.]|nr:GNAT family N-acetyltransferase [Marinicaulis sp.]NNE39935.1 GNAT family N-acetyltransferase [Marinicaulis sp.]
MADAVEITDILSEAFADDPFMLWMVGSEKAIRGLFDVFTRDVYLIHGFGHIDDRGAATLWLPAGASGSLSFFGHLRMGWSILLGGGFTAINRMTVTEKAAIKAHPNTPHYYLFAVGVRTSQQGRGLGAAVIREGLKRADSENALAYLENSKPRNTPLYERLGFVTQRRLDIPEAPPLLAMLRQPHQANAS